MEDTVYGFFKRNDVKCVRNFSMKSASSARIGGDASLAISPDTNCKMRTALKFLAENNIKYKIVGGMSNLLPCDGVYGGVLVRTDGLTGYSVDGVRLNVSAGERLGRVVSQLASQGIGGLSELAGIPGCIGGSAVGNAGAFGREISDVILDATLYDCDSDEIVTVRADELGYSYRQCDFFREHSCCVLSVSLKVSENLPGLIRGELDALRKRRHSCQPTLPSLGSVFKRYNGLSAGWYVDRAGLKGKRVGDAAVSDKHAGFIINLGNATAADYVALASEVRKNVRDTFGVDLSYEVEFMN